MQRWIANVAGSLELIPVGHWLLVQVDPVRAWKGGSTGAVPIACQASSFYSIRHFLDKYFVEPEMG